MKTANLSRFTFYVLRFTILSIGGLAVTRIMYELFFPQQLWLGRPFPALTLSLSISLIIGWICQRFPPSPQGPKIAHPFTLSPLLLNLLYLFNLTVNLVQSRFIFAASLWLTAVFLMHVSKDGRSGHSTKQHDFPSIPSLHDILLLLVALIPVYFLTMSTTVGRADTFEFQVVAPQLGIAHPTGYPLYLLLGKLFTLIPIGSVAWRLNAGTAVYALTAATLLYLTGRKLLDNPLIALLGAVAIGLTPTFWSQAIEAEVYSLHALIITAALYLMVMINDSRLKIGQPPAMNRQSLFINHYALFFLIGLELTNHLTTVFLIPPALLALFFSFRLQPSSFRLQPLFNLALAFLTPLTLYAYLPIRWAAVNDEAMGYGRFLQWVTGSRFQGALQWRAWLVDPTRYEVVGRLFLENWGWINLIIALIGLIYLFVKQWRMALILLVTWLGYAFYNLNYYVPDLDVFLLPAQIQIALWWIAGITALLKIGDWKLGTRNWNLATNLDPLVSSLILIPIIMLTVQSWPQIDRSQDDGLTEWGQGVLGMPLAENAAILADSEKIAPLYYLQQAEGIRPDLNIMVLPDEAAYRAELDGRIAAGQTVYLARFLPGLEGVYHLRSLGPLTEVSAQPLTELPSSTIPIDLSFNNTQLIGYELEPEAAIDEMSTAVTLYWQTNHQQPTTSNQLIYIRWANQDIIPGQYPANNYYPVLAWDPGEIVPDYHLLPHPLSQWEQRLKIQVALAPPFTSTEALAWQTVTTLTLPPTEKLVLQRPYRTQIGNTFLDSAQFPTQIRPGQPLPITISGYGTADSLLFSLSNDQPGSGQDVPLKIVPLQTGPPFTVEVGIQTGIENGRYQLIVSQPHTAALCGWLQPVSHGCVLGEVEISGVPLPDSATNFEDKIALLNIDLPQTQLQPGIQFPVTLTWQSLAPIAEDYTVFIQILDANDRIVGQVDAWPLQGTLPTSQWTPDETITDPYLIWLDGDLPPGQYRLIVGWYLLGTSRRLPVLDENGQPIDDKLLVPGLVVP